MRAFLFVFRYDDVTLYERFMGATALQANARFECEWPNATLIHIQVVG